MRIFTVDQKNGVRTQNTSPLPIMLFRWEKYRFISQYEGFLIFHFSTFIAVLESDKVNGTYAIYGGNHRKRSAISGPALI